MLDIENTKTNYLFTHRLFTQVIDVIKGCRWDGCLATVTSGQGAERRQSFRLCKLFAFITERQVKISLHI